MAAHGVKLSLPTRIGLAVPVVMFLTLTLGRACVIAYVDAQLAQAAREGQTEQVGCWLARGANINAQDVFGDTPLMIAARHAHPGVVQILLARGANAQMRIISDSRPRTGRFSTCETAALCAVLTAYKSDKSRVRTLYKPLRC